MVKVLRCDLCDSEQLAKTVHIKTGRQPDGAGGSEDITESFDLCHDHAMFTIELMAKNMYTQNELKKVVSELRKRKLHAHS